MHTCNYIILTMCVKWISIIVCLHGIFSGILAGIFPDACTEETFKFMKLNFQADVLITDCTTLQALLKVSYGNNQGRC